MTQMTVRVSELPEDLKARMAGPVPPPNFECDGATGAFDIVLAFDARPAAAWHDFYYRIVGGNIESRKEADRLLFRNLLACHVWRCRALWWYVAVRLCGWKHFRFADPAYRRQERLHSVLVSVCLAACAAVGCWWVWR